MVFKHIAAENVIAYHTKRQYTTMGYLPWSRIADGQLPEGDRNGTRYRSLFETDLIKKEKT